MSTDNQPATRKDLRDFRDDIIEDITGVLSDAMTVIGSEFQTMKSEFRSLKSEFVAMRSDFQTMKIDLHDVSNSQNRIEQKLDATIDIVDNHSVRIFKVEQKSAKT